MMSPRAPISAAWRFCRLILSHAVGRVPRLFLLVLIVCGTVTVGRGPGYAADEGISFREFLAETPWIRHVVYRRSLSYERVHAADRPGAPEELLPRLHVLGEYEGAWQPKGWYLRCFMDILYPLYSAKAGWLFTNVPEPGLEYVIGANEEYQWRISPRHAVVTIDPLPGRPGHVGSMGVVHAYYESQLRRMLRLGLDLMGLGRLAWQDERRFTVEPSVLTGVYKWPNPGGRGEIVRLDELGRPLEVVYQVRGSAPDTPPVRVLYSYKEGVRFPPHGILVFEEVPGEGLVVHTNYIDELVVGLDPQAPRGYYPEQFRSTRVPLSRLLVWSNLTRYEITRDGQWIEAPTPAYEPLPEEVSSRFLRNLLFGVVMLGLLAAGWMWWRFRRVATDRSGKSAPS